ncbi:MAG TPA: ABC transporter substrate-binding protein, partial [Clostridia bacterium]|nr:ABC transporter substrate-binding protein [Clostridia bacterium]
MFKKTLAIICAILIILSCFAACSGKDGSNAHLVYPIENEPRSLDPQITADAAGCIIITNCFEGLVRINENGEIVPGVAKDWTVSTDGLEYTFHLADDSRWHLMSKFSTVLGKGFEKTFDIRVTAQDFVFGLRRAVMPLTASPYASSLFMIKNAGQVNNGSLEPGKLGVTAVDDYTLKITLANQTADFLNILASPVSMPCNETFFDAVKGKYGLGSNYLLCNGPFYLAEWEQGLALKLRKFKSDAYTSGAVPSSVTLKISQDTAKYGQNITLDVYSAAQISATAAASLQASGGITLKEYPNITQAICLNFAEKSLSNRSIRLALCKALDKTAVGLAFDGETPTDRL